MSLILCSAPSVSPRGWCTEAAIVSVPKKKKKRGSDSEGYRHLFSFNVQDMELSARLCLYFLRETGSNSQIYFLKNGGKNV